jgi:hypothetical protein
MIQASKLDVPCDAPFGTERTPVTFGSFNVTDVRPIDVFNTLADVDNQLPWDVSINSAQKLGEWKSEGVRGLAYAYPTGTIVADREVFEWAAYSTNYITQEFWLVLSSLGDRRLNAIRPRRDDAVPIQNCLVAYRIRSQPGGAALVTFTHHQNVHPPLMLSGRDAFALSWAKIVDWANALREQSQMVAKQGRISSHSVVPTWLSQGPPLKQSAPSRDPMTPFNLTGRDPRFLLADETSVKPAHQVGHRDLRFGILGLCGALAYACMCLRTYACTRYIYKRNVPEKDGEIGESHEKEETSGADSSSDTESSSADDRLS